MKTCSRCRIPKTDDEFVKQLSSKDGLGAYCRHCRRDYGKTYAKTPKGRAVRNAYMRTPKGIELRKTFRESHREELRTGWTTKIAVNRNLIETLKRDQPCSACGEIFPPVALDFDHVQGEKRRGVTQMASYSESSILAEVKKCEIVCANCHRVRTAAKGEKSSRPEVVSFRMWLNQIKDRPCLDCGKIFPPVAMDFDHVYGTKLASIGNMWGQSREKVLLELSKCEIVCACCHRKRTEVRKETQWA